jgi:hypothetical protein
LIWLKAASIASLPDEDFDDDYDDDNESSNEVETIIENDINDCDNHRIHSHNHNQLNDNFCNFSFEISDNYNYRDANTPTNSSPASSSCLHSPGSFPLDSPSPPPTAADFCEFFQASGRITKELGDLTLTDKEQRELYAAARVIQRTFRSYKGLSYAFISIFYTFCQFLFFVWISQWKIFYQKTQFYNFPYFMPWDQIAFRMFSMSIFFKLILKFFLIIFSFIIFPLFPK